MRSNVVFGSLILMLGAFFAGLFLRARPHHEAPPVAAEADTGATTTHDADANATAIPDAASASAAPSASGSAPPPAAGPSLGRPLRVVALDWELLAPGVMAAGGGESTQDSAFGKKGLTVALRAIDDVERLEGALARGGKDEKGADVAILPFPRFVASYERLAALEPVVFLAVAWSDGRDVLLSKKDSLAALPARGDVTLAARPGEPATFLALFAFDLAGVAPDRVKLGDKGDFAAMTRDQSKAESEQVRDNLILTTAQASRLVPFVAIAQRALVAAEAEALVAFGEGWLEGDALVARDAAEAARKIAEIKNAPEPLAILRAFGQLRPASLRDNAHLLGLAGRDPITLASLFDRAWSLWRAAKVLTIPPESAPIDGRIVATMVRAGGTLEGPPPKPAPKAARRAGPLIVHRAEATLDEEVFVERVGLLAGAFPRSPIVVTMHPKGIRDDALGASLVARVRERYGLPEGRVTTGKAKPSPGSAATVEVDEIP